MIIEKHHSLKEYMLRFGKEYEAGNLWDFSKADVKSGAIELPSDGHYWLIRGRYYEVE